MTKEFNASLAKAIKDGISKFQSTIAKNQAKEKNGLAKLSKTLGGQDPALTGAGGDLSAGSAMTEVPNLARASSDLMRSAASAREASRSARVKGNGEGNQATYLHGGNPTDEGNERAVAKDKKAKKNNTRAEHEASKVEKGALPEGGGPGVPGGVGDMNSNADAGFGASEKDMNKDELGMDSPGCGACGSNSIVPMGMLGNTNYVKCMGCGNIGTTPREENTEAKEVVDPTVAKAVIPFNKPKKKGPGEGWITTRNNPANNHFLAFSSYQIPKDVERAKKNNTRAEHEASKVEKSMAKLPDGSGCATGVVKSEPLATMRTTKMKGISGLPAPKSKMVVKAELEKVAPPGEERLVHKLKNEYGHDTAGKKKAFATAWAIHNKTVNKAELISNKESEQVGTVAAKNVKGAKDGSEKVPEAKKTDDSGDVSKGKIEKGAMVDHIKAASAKAGVPVKSVLGYQPPKTLAAVKPAPTPAFNKSTIPMVGVAREMAVKTGKPVIPGRPMVTKLTGGVQGQIAAQKNPLIPMVNKGVVAKGENDFSYGRPTKGKIQLGYDATKDSKTETLFGKEPKVLHPSDKKKVTKAEPTMAKPVTKSPGSAPAAKTAAPKAPVAMKTQAPKL